MLPIDEYDLRTRRDEDFAGPPPTLSERAVEVLRALVARPKIKMMDWSRYQAGEVKDIQAIKDAGFVVVILQATYGYKTDSSFNTFWPILIDNGFVVMTYHMYYAGLSGVDQAHHHLEIVRPMWEAQGARYPAILDVEVRDGIAIPVRVSRAQNFTGEIRKETKPGTYCSYYLWQELMGNIPLGDQIGFCAAWSPYETFALPVGWIAEQTIMRQIGISRKHPWVEIVEGMAGDVDTGVIYLTLEELYKLADRTPPPVPIPEPEPEEPPMSNVVDQLKAARDEVVAIYSKADDIATALNAVIAELEAETPPTSKPPSSPPPPTPVTTWKMRVTEEPRTNARCFEVWNEDQKRLIPKTDTSSYHKPIMVFYQRPGSGSLTSGRVQIEKSENILVFPEVVTAAGGERFHEIYMLRGEHNERLFLPKASLIKVA